MWNLYRDYVLDANMEDSIIKVVLASERLALKLYKKNIQDNEVELYFKKRVSIFKFAIKVKLISTEKYTTLIFFNSNFDLINIIDKSQKKFVIKCFYYLLQLDLDDL
ncbi:MAG: hypothetical protein ACOWWH_07095 [Eubacteriaceae bacterium]